MIKKLILFLIKIYQKTLSPDHGFFRIRFLGCRFYPSCSDYMSQAIEKYGLVKGSYLGIKRILRCHPFNQGGIDYLP